MQKKVSCLDLESLVGLGPFIEQSAIGFYSRRSIIEPSEVKVVRHVFKFTCKIGHDVGE